MIIAITISGKSGSGKDTFADIIREELEKINKRVLIIHFADLVKFYARAYFNWDGVKDERGRTLLQTLGTDMVRAHAPNYWAKIVGEFIGIMGETNTFDYALVPDARFPNEIEAVKWYVPHTYSVNVVRTNADGTAWTNPLFTEEQKQHPSETSLDNYNDFSLVIHNDKDLTNLRNLAVDLIIRLEKKYATERDGT